MPRPVGYYVHHQGAGHLHRARLIAGALKRPCTLLGTFTEPGGGGMLSLPDDRTDVGFDGKDGTSNRPEAFHYAPVNHAGIRTRMTVIAAWVAANDPALMIVDVSAEVALFVRLLSVPLLLVRLAGCRDDQPHLEAFRAAEALIAPFPAAFESPKTAPWIQNKTFYAGFLAPPIAAAVVPPVLREIAVVFGRGGAPFEIERLTAAARATPDWTWRVHGDLSAEGLPTNLRLCGWVDEIEAALDRAEIVIGGAGDGLLSAIVARSKRFVCLPGPRAFDEQMAKAQVLAARNLAIVVPDWPVASEWPNILLRARALDPTRLHAFHDCDAVAKTAAEIETMCSRIKTLGLLEPRPS